LRTIAPKLIFCREKGFAVATKRQFLILNTVKMAFLLNPLLN
jgi:hypothetical protein